MRRTDRLFQIIQTLRRREVVTAQQLAQSLEVSERTIYRDVEELVACGVPIEGEAGIGYRLRGYDLPPLMFTQREVEALVLGARIVESWADSELGRAAASVLDKVEAVLPPQRRASIRATPLFAPKGHAKAPITIDAARLRQAVIDSVKVAIDYVDGQERITSRTIHPLAMAFYGPIWLLIAWCEKREDFRTFRLDRIHQIAVTEESIPNEPERSLDAFLTKMRADE